MSFLERAKAGVKEEFAYSEECVGYVQALWANLLRSADHENRLNFLKGLAKRQKAAARIFKRKDPITSLLNKSDYYRTLADIAALEKESEETDLATCQLCDAVKDCYLSPVDLEEAPAPAEAEPAEEVAPVDEAPAEEAPTEEAAAGDAPAEDNSAFSDTDKPVEGLAELMAQPVGEAAESAEGEAKAPKERDIDDAS